MVKTTIYLPDELKAQVTRAAAERGVSEAEVIRAAVADAVGSRRPKPRGGLFHGGGTSIAERADEFLAGFGER